MQSSAWLTIDGGSPVAVLPGEYVGRSPRAALCISDPRVSEAHALVSLRGGALWLLGLRGRFRVEGVVLSEVELVPGIRVDLTPETSICCHAIELPERMMAVTIPELGRPVLTGTASLVAGKPPRLLPGLVPDAAAVFWSLGEQWYLRQSNGQDTPLEPGTPQVVDGLRLTPVLVRPARGSRTRTVPQTGPCLEVRIGPQGVLVRADGHGERARLGGVHGRLLGALLAADEPVHWTDLCHRIWPDDRSELGSLRNRLDVAVTRLRQRLRELDLHGINVSFDGLGHVRVVVAEGIHLHRQRGDG